MQNERQQPAFRTTHWLTILLFVWFFTPSLPYRPNATPSAPMVLAVGESAATPDASSLVTTTDGLPQRPELMERLGVRSWHAHGWRGRGLKVAILDSGFRGYQTHLGKALPPVVKVRSFRFDGNLQAKNSQHGILCAEVIHTLAPEAELLLANWEPEHPDQFLAAVRWARQEGARIISCSVIMPTWSDCEGHGRVHEELTHLLGTGERADDAVFVASAGNTAQRHWSGTFRDGGEGYHAWKWTNGIGQTENAIKPWGSERVSVELCCPLSAGYEVMVTDATTERPLGRARSLSVRGIGNAVVAFVPKIGHDYRVRVRQIRSASGGFHLVVLGGGLRHVSSQGSIPFPGDGSEVLAVGAVDLTGRRLRYSSCGSKHGDTKPNFVATVPFPSDWRSKPFSGTSAAAPQAAALSALVWSRHPDWSAQRIRDTLQNAARPCSSGSPAWATGHGLIHLPTAESPDSAATSPNGRSLLQSR